MFRAPCAHHQEVKIALHRLWYHHTETNEWSKITKSPKIRKITNLLKNTNIGIVFKTTTTLHHLIKPQQQPRYKNMKKVEYTKLRARPATKLMSGRQVKLKIKIPRTHTLH